MPRAILNWQVLGNDLVGTHHLPENSRAPLAPSLGMLLLNAGPAPRAGNSDLSVHIGDRLASRGIPVFRFDLPGLGDSSGPVPTDIDTFWREVLAGRNDESTLILIREIRRRFNLSSLVVGGLCAAAVPALRAADFDDCGVAGVLLLEPQFRMTDVPILQLPATADRSHRARQRAKLRRALSSREWLYALTGDGRLASAVQPLRPLLLRALHRSVGHTLPKDTNIHLVSRLNNCLARGVHSLAIIAQDHISDRFVTRILDTLPPHRRGTSTLVRIPRTNHILTTGPARDLVLHSVEQWMRERLGIEPGPLSVPESRFAPDDALQRRASA